MAKEKMIRKENKKMMILMKRRYAIYVVILIRILILCHVDISLAKNAFRLIC